MLRCPPSRIHITIEDLNEPKQKAASHMADRAAPSSSRPIRPRSIESAETATYSSELPGLQLRAGPSHARDECLVRAPAQHVASAAARSLTGGGPFQKTRRSVHSERPSHVLVSSIRRSKSHSIGYNNSSEAPEHVISPTSTDSRHAEERAKASRIPTIGPYSDEPLRQAHSRHDSGPGREKKPGDQSSAEDERPAEQPMSPGIQLHPVSDEDTIFADIEDVGSKAQWSGNQNRPSRADHPFLRECSPLQELANKLRQLAASPLLQETSTPKTPSSASTASPRLLSGGLFYDRPGKTLAQRGRHTRALAQGSETGAVYRPLEAFRADGCGHLLYQMSSTPRISASMHEPVTPQIEHRASHVQRGASTQSRRRTVPRVRVYDDERPASMQPQTPADMRRRHNTARDPSESVPVRRPRRLSEAIHDPIALIVPSTESRYPGLQNFPSTYDLRSRVSMNAGVDAVSPLHHDRRRRFHLSHELSQENDANSEDEGPV